ncbi:methyl-accepting chemotaxis protein [Thalassobaculum sp.]|uniref:methyl-accepting chemotaxis protein n=1 Tax=Thalassobaculum sp. TaxID=2022740 RepID=UPI0032EC184F
MSVIEPSAGVEESGRRTGFGIGARLYAAFGATTALTVIAVGVAWVAFENVRGTMDDVANRALPVLTASLQLAAQSATAAAVAPNIISAPTESARDAARAAMKSNLASVDEGTETLARFDAATGEAIRPLAQGLRDQLAALDDAVKRRQIARSGLATAVQQVLDVHKSFLGDIRPLVDDATFNLVIASEDTTSEVSDKIDSLVQKEVAALQAALTLSGEGQRLLGIMARSARIETVETLADEEALFGRAAIDMQKTIASLPQSPEGETLATLAKKLMSYGFGEWSVFAIRTGELTWVDLTPEQYDAVQAHRKTFDGEIVEIARAFDDAVKPVVDAARIALIGGSSDLSANLEERISTLIDKDVTNLRQMLETLAEANMVIGLMSTAASAPDIDRLSVLENTFVASGQTLDTLATAMEAGDGMADIAAKVRALIAAGQGDDSVFQRRRGVLAEEQAASDALTEVQTLTRQFDTVVNQQVAQALEAAQRDSGAAFVAIDRSEYMLFAIAGAGVAIGILIGWIVVNRQVVRRLMSLAETMRVIAGGNHNTEVDAQGNDEITEMARAVEVFRNNAIEMEKLREDQVAAERKASEERHNQRIQLADSFESRVKGIVDRLGTAAREMTTNAQAMTGGAADVRDQSINGASVAQETSANVQTVASAAEELSASIREISSKISQSSSRAREAADQAETTNQRVESLEQAARRIDTVVTLIQDIAEQTNLLALNATIEAARAGEAGKGFAVVAGEVKSLAGQTARATDEITQQIKEVQDGVASAVVAIREVAGAIREIDGYVTAIAGAVEEQDASTQEIARSSQDAAEGTNEVTRTIEGVSAVANDTGVQAEAVLAAAEALAGDADLLDKEVTGFLDQVRGRSSS